jgi:hypothetical protein
LRVKYLLLQLSLLRVKFLLSDLVNAPVVELVDTLC